MSVFARLRRISLAHNKSRDSISSTITKPEKSEGSIKNGPVSPVVSPPTSPRSTRSIVQQAPQLPPLPFDALTIDEMAKPLVPFRRTRVETSEELSYGLPVEIWGSIFQHAFHLDESDDVNRRTLYNIMFVCQLFRKEAEHVLYRRIHLPSHTASELNLRVTFFNHLAKFPRMASLVRSLYIPAIIAEPGQFVNQTPFWSALHSALQHMSSLEELTLWRFDEPNLHPNPSVATDRTGWRYDPVRLLTGCKGPLRELKIDGERFDVFLTSSNDRSGTITTTLPVPAPSAIAEGSLHHVVVVGRQAPIEGFVDHRHLRALHLAYCEDENSPILADTGRLGNPLWMPNPVVLPQVTSLKIRLHMPSVSQLPRIFPSLRFLGLVFYSPQDEDYLNTITLHSEHGSSGSSAPPSLGLLGCLVLFKNLKCLSMEHIHKPYDFTGMWISRVFRALPVGIEAVFFGRSQFILGSYANHMPNPNEWKNIKWAGPTWQGAVDL